MPKQKQISREKYINYEQEKISKEFGRKRLILKYEKIAMIIIIFLVFFGVGFSIYHLIKNSQKEEKQTENQTIDAPPEGFMITTKQVKILPESATRYDAYLKILNQDQNWGVVKLDYKITLKGADKKTVGERTGATFILPNQEKSIIELGINTSAKALTTSTNLEIKEVQKLTESPIIKLAAENLNYQVIDNKSKVLGAITNQTPFGFDEIIINVLVYDNNNNLKGANFTTINTLTPNQKRDFTVFWRKNLNVKNPKIVVESFVNPFNSQPFLDVYSEGQMLEY